MMQDHADETIRQEGNWRTLALPDSPYCSESIRPPDSRMKRRGILAALGAAVAGMLAKKAAEPVAAGLGNGTPINVGEDSRGSSKTYLYAFEANSAVTFVSDVVWEADASRLPDTVAGGATPYTVSGIRATGKGT